MKPPLGVGGHITNNLRNISIINSTYLVVFQLKLISKQKKSIFMKSLFITIRFDRMKNMDIVTLYHRLITYTKQFTSNSDLLKAANKLELHKNQSEVLHPKQRKQPHTAEITKLRAANDKLIAAILLHLKALNYAAFDEEKSALFKWEKTLAKELKNYKRKLIQEKDVIRHTLLQRANNDAIKTDFNTLGLTRFIDKLKQTDDSIDMLLGKQKEIRATLPAPNTTIPTKEKLIDEIRFFLRTVEMHLMLNPDLNEKNLVDMINVVLKEYRAQLRNTTTRRIKRREKMAKISQNQDLQN